jgi:hypothetical protein
MRGLALALGVLAACTSGEPPVAAAPPAREPSSASPSAPAPEPTPTIRPTPAPERERVRFAGRIDPLPSAIRREMRGTTWQPGCPVGLDRLRLLRFNYHGFDGQIHRGPMVVHAFVARDVLWVFEQLFEAGFPLKKVALARRWRPNGPTDTTRSITAAFNCRPALNPDGTPSDRYSEHAYGLAIDVNPLQNPYVAPDGSVLRPAAEAYLDRSQDLPGMIHAGDVVVRSFAAIGWEWGGHWSGSKDYMHFSLRGR